VDKQEPLRDAARNGRLEDVKKYLNDGAVDVDGKDKRGWTPLHYAGMGGHRDIAETHSVGSWGRYECP
jgi:ankyrin repeat protein